MTPPPSSRSSNAPAGLQISNTLIESWASIDNLNTYEILTSLRFSNSPVTSKMGGSEARAVIVARVSRCHFLNASTVSAKERNEAEKMYLRRCGRELQVS